MIDEHDFRRLESAIKGLKQVIDEKGAVDKLAPMQRQRAKELLRESNAVLKKEAWSKRIRGFDDF